jgi:hypothetical protein
MQRAGIKDILSGLIFLGMGAAFGYAATGYPLGTALRMGPGYFPLVLAGVLMALGLAIGAKGLTAAAADGGIGRVPWRAIVLILGALVFFGATIRGIGLGPAVFGTALLSALGSRQNGPVGAFAIAAAMTILCILVFHYGLGIAVPVVGPWLKFGG